MDQRIGSHPVPCRIVWCKRAACIAAKALIAEHAAGEHADFVDMDCPTCVAEQREIGGHA